MADIKEPRVNLILDALTARIEEDMASLYSAFVAKLLKAETGKQSTVIEEYIGDRFDVRARWYLSAVRKESHVEPYLAILDRTGKMDVEVLIAHFASSLPHRELVDARIVGRRFYWKSEAMRRVREKAALPRVASVTLPETAVGISNLAPSRPAPATPAPAEDPPKPEGASDTVPNAKSDTESANQEAWRSRIEAALSPDQQTRLETLMARVAELLKEQATQHGGSVPARFYGITEALSTGDFFSMAPQDAYELLERTVAELPGTDTTPRALEAASAQSHLSGRIARWEGEANERTSSLPPAEAKAAVRPSAANTVEIATTEPGGDTPATAEEPTFAQASTVMGGSRIPVDTVAADRAALLTAYKAKGRGKGVRITDAMVAMAAHPGKWNDRTMVTWWKRNDQRCKPPHDRKIRAVLAKDPSDIWSPSIKSKHPPK
jgi:hypothetical protein